ncbi:MAG: amidase [Dactylosporangium sp.]|nr:amidase [Dactylosporangium sp.]NNJ63382.1 amidase [Dactylosporangium sp.]
MLQRSGTWVGATARDIARAVRRGDTSATAVVADHLDSVTAHDRILNAFRLVRPESVAEAEIVDEQPELGDLALAGVPIAVKENTAVTGLPTWNGSNVARQPVAEGDHEVVRRLRGAGAVVLGVTRMSELGSFCVTDDVTGVTRNPWRTDRTPGGSSGGAAAAVAAGLVPIAHGTDSMGSIRIPAACCGLVGIKPGRGVVPSEVESDDQFAIGEHGIVATTVADAALGFFVLAGREPRRLVPPARLRIACTTRSPIPGARADTGARRALSDAGRALVAMGHDAVSANPAFPASIQVRGLATWFAAAYVGAENTHIDQRELQPRSRRQVRLGRLAMDRGLVREVDRAAWREQCHEWFADHRFDVLITPALATAPPLATDWAARSWTANVAACLRYAPYSAPWNLAGFPAVVVPVGVRSDGLPAAVQLVGPPGAELTLLALAGQVEQLAPWRRHAPGWPRPASRRFP